MNVRAKFVVESITVTTNGTNVKLKPVTATSPENERFFRWTPFGVLEMGILNPDAAEVFVPGTEMYVDFTPILKF